MKYTGPKVKLSRKLGIPLSDKAAKVMEKKPYPPGQHGPALARRRSESDYKRQLREKQKLRAQYNIHERQLVNYFKKASKIKGVTSDNLIRFLEARLDAVVLRGGLARSIYQARQFVNHGHILVNGKSVNLPAYTVKLNDVVSVSDKSRKIPGFHEAVQNARPPVYMELDKPGLAVRMKDSPEREDIPVICDLQQVVEYYSK